MATRGRSRGTRGLGHDPLASDEEILRETFFRPSGAADSRAQDEREVSWRVISISLYPEDLERIDALVASLRAAGHRRANRSALIRHAIATVDPATYPRGA
jgi:hypothetical protein